MKWTIIASPIGDLLAARDEVGLTELQLPQGKRPQAPRVGWERDDGAFADVRGELDEYFAGTRREFTVPLHPAGSPFQLRVWAALAEIPYGETTSYGKTAVAIGSPTASRAVGLANGQNPIPIIVPCHRVVGANGSLTGYGGGLDAKRWLLAHEASHAGLFAS
ncbi:MAG: methylated-DNA--[protein]-cysteine S-methyltransferase [Jatrophihabitans sp.]|uniref:methylated-DNA--[protein]-cysteine S-methyltransferase n=1 Tax=Jatrophihabitans sp. TaxID=1932789 RepID=UPI003F7D17DA